VGSGPGTITLDLAARLSAGRVVGVDSADAAVQAARQSAREVGADHVQFEMGDVYALDFPTASFDVVHAHQVLQHLSDPVAALAEMRRVCRPGGLVAARDADYAAMTWYPDNPGLSRWLALYRQVARSNSAEPDAGRRLRSWALQADFARVEASASVWCYTEAVDVDWWSDTWAERVRSSSFAQQAVARGFADASELDALSAAWRSWGSSPAAWFTVLHGEVICTV
jgi:ubiquinone/menaquinone biosynthesis C-methylase UbiE